MTTKTFKQIATLDPKRLMIVDTLNLAFRYKHANATDFLESYMETVASLRRSYNCGKLILAGDYGSSSFRKAIYPEYKANRAEKYATQTEAERISFMEFLEEVTSILETYAETTDIPVLRFAGVEADDIAAYICKKQKGYGVHEIWLMSSDKDWDLLISPSVSRFSYVTRKEITWDTWNEHYDYNPEDHISVKVLQGDSGDNIKGVPGIGPKKAAGLIQEYGSAYDIMANLPISSKYKYIQSLNEFGADNLQLNYQLMDLPEFCEEAIGEENCKIIDSILAGYLEPK